MPTPIVVDDKSKHLLRAIPYFRVLDEHILTIVAQLVTVHQYKMGEIIFLEGDRVAGLHMVAEGLCKVYRLSEGGREHVLATLGAGDSCNEVPAVDGGPNPANFAAIEDSTVWVISEPALTDLRKRFPVLNEVIIENLAMRCRQLVRRVYNLSFLSVTGRLAAFLIEQSDEKNILSRRRWTQDEIAAHLGTVREMVGRGLRELQEAELILLDRHRIEILDKDGLKTLI